MKTKAGETVFGIVCVVLSIPAWIYFAWVNTKLWSWFIVPLGLPVISVPQAMGIWLTAGTVYASSMVMLSTAAWRDRSAERSVNWLVVAYLMPTVTWAVGAALTLFL